MHNLLRCHAVRRQRECEVAMVDAALCFGWIDGVRKRIDEHSYQIRFTPRKPLSIWSAINVERVPHAGLRLLQFGMARGGKARGRRV